MPPAPFLSHIYPLPFYTLTSGETTYAPNLATPPSPTKLHAQNYFASLHRARCAPHSGEWNVFKGTGEHQLRSGCTMRGPTKSGQAALCRFYSIGCLLTRCCEVLLENERYTKSAALEFSFSFLFLLLLLLFVRQNLKYNYKHARHGFFPCAKKETTQPQSTFQLFPASLPFLFPPQAHDPRTALNKTHTPPLNPTTFFFFCFCRRHIYLLEKKSISIIIIINNKNNKNNNATNEK